MPCKESYVSCAPVLVFTLALPECLVRTPRDRQLLRAIEWIQVRQQSEAVGIINKKINFKDKFNRLFIPQTFLFLEGVRKDKINLHFLYEMRRQIVNP